MATKNRCVGLLLAAAVVGILVAAIPASASTMTWEDRTVKSAADIYTYGDVIQAVKWGNNGATPTVNSVTYTNETIPGWTQESGNSGFSTASPSDANLSSLMSNGLYSAASTDFTYADCLTVGDTYVLQLLGFCTNAASLRKANVTVEGEQYGSLWSIVYADGDHTTGKLLSCTFTATDTTLNFNVDGQADVVLAGFNLQSVAPVPEPSTMILLGCGLAGLLAYAWRKRK